MRIRLGREPLAGLVLELAATRGGHGALGNRAFRLAERLRQLGIGSARSRSATLFQLATELPAAVLARMLGIHITVAVAWQQRQQRRLDQLRGRSQPTCLRSRCERFDPKAT